MTNREKYNKIMEWFSDFENKASFCYDLETYLEAEGVGGTASFSIYRNWFRPHVGSIPKNKINYVYEFTKVYWGNINSESREENDPRGVESVLQSTRKDGEPIS